MKKEEKDRSEMLDIMQKLKTRIDKQTFFISGVAATIIVVWALVKLLIK